ncbi:hypothetical protein [Halothiobacillus sp.]|uniref:hypothetical protein n=1 Tax=Halothiobacillus sp. TaxID=1891311 RepID=UPI002614864F|nr:hypothetical protein [Halothiobacillus sp.]MDD4965759.1 hypothetical protein [Halothiobacillus sp.]
MTEVLFDACKITLIFAVVFAPFLFLARWNGPRYRREMEEASRIARRKRDLEEAFGAPVDN